MARELCIIGLNYSTAPVEVRETLSVKPGTIGDLARSVIDQVGLQEMVLLSTCGRFEAYTMATAEEVDRIALWFNTRARQELKKHLYIHSGRTAAEHLFRVASGLDSWVLGETEILGQVKTAYQQACAAKTAGRTLHLAFQRALHVGKHVRNQTGIVGGIRSIGGAAALLARRIFTDLEKQQILIFGAGVMAESAVRHLAAKGVAEICVCNRTLAKAQELASRLKGKALDIEEGLGRLSEAGVAIFSTASDKHLLDGVEARKVLARRNGRPLFLIDISVPRNIDPEVGKLSGIYLYNIDDLRGVVRENMSRREEEVEKAERIVIAETDEFWGNRTSQSQGTMSSILVPTPTS